MTIESFRHRKGGDVMESWRERYQPMAMIKGEYIPCPGSINHYATVLPNEDVINACDDPEPEDDDIYPTEKCYR